MAYSPTVYVNDSPPALSAANFNKAETELGLLDGGLNAIRTSDGDNCFNEDSLLASGITCVNGEYIGTVTAFDDAHGTSNPIAVNCKANTAYTFSFKAYNEGNVDSSSGRTGINVQILRNDGTMVNCTLYNDVSSFQQFSVSSTSTSKTVIGIIFKFVHDGNNIWHFKELMLNEGETAQSYVPYYTAEDRKSRADILSAKNLGGFPVVKKDIRWVNGSLKSATGKDNSYVNNTQYIKPADYLTDIVDIKTDYKMVVCYYDKDYEFISNTSFATNGAHWTNDLMPVNAKYIRFHINKSDMGITVNNVNDHVTVLQAPSKAITRLDEVDDYVPYGKQYYYDGEKIVIKPRVTVDLMLHATIKQDGALIGNKLFEFTPDGTFDVYDLFTTLQDATNCVMGLPTENVAPHCNSVCLGVEQNADDYPYIYVNAYNAAGLSKGTCYVYSLAYSNSTYSASIVQTISIGFTTETIWDDGTSDRPYGNFIVDRDNGYLYVITKQSSTNTRMFKFELPEISDGASITLSQNDILEQYDLPLFAYIQGGKIYKNKLYQLSGMSSSGRLFVVDLDKKALVSTIKLPDLELTSEPEFIDIKDNYILIGMTYYVYRLQFD